MDNREHLAEERANTVAHNLVQQLFCVGMDLHRAHTQTSHGPASSHLDVAIAGVDWTINEIRRTTHNHETPDRLTAHTAEGA